MSARPVTFPDAAVTAGPAAGSNAESSPWLRVLLILGGALTAVSFAAMVLLLASYFLAITAWPVFYWFGLFGFPLGFALMLSYVVIKAVLRRRA